MIYIFYSLIAILITFFIFKLADKGKLSFLAPNKEIYSNKYQNIYIWMIAISIVIGFLWAFKN